MQRGGWTVRPPPSEGSACLMDKVQNHHERSRCPHYQSFLLRHLVQCLPMSPMGRGTLFIHLEPQRCWATYSDLRRPDESGPSPHCCVIHAEVVTEERLHNLILLGTATRCLIIGFLVDPAITMSIPWDLILPRLRWREHLADPVQLHTPQLLNPGENPQTANPMRYLLWLHALLAYRGDHDVQFDEGLVETMLHLKTTYDRTRREPMVGSALYELHLLDHVVPWRSCSNTIDNGTSYWRTGHGRQTRVGSSS